MGSSNVTCLASKLSIGHNDEIVFVPLISVDNTGETYMIGSSSLVSNNPTKYSFKPLTLPLFGRYNDYGGVQALEETAGTTQLRKQLEKPLEDWLAQICGYGEESPTIGTEPISGTFVLREVYNEAVKFMRNRHTKPVGGKYDLDTLIAESKTLLTKCRYDIEEMGLNKVSDTKLQYYLDKQPLITNILTEDINRELADMLYFEWYLFEVNTMWQPMLSGPQCGAPASNKHLLDVTLKILNRIDYETS